MLRAFWTLQIWTSIKEKATAKPKHQIKNEKVYKKKRELEGWICVVGIIDAVLTKIPHALFKRSVPALMIS